MTGEHKITRGTETVRIQHWLLACSTSRFWNQQLKLPKDRFKQTLLNQLNWQDYHLFSYLKKVFYHFPQKFFAQHATDILGTKNKNNTKKLKQNNPLTSGEKWRQHLPKHMILFLHSNTNRRSRQLKQNFTWVEKRQFISESKAKPYKGLLPIMFLSTHCLLLHLIDYMDNFNPKG